MLQLHQNHMLKGLYTMVEELNNIKEGSVEHLKQLMDDLKESIEKIDDRLNNAFSHIKQTNEKIGSLEQRLRQAGVRLRKS